MSHLVIVGGTKGIGRAFAALAAEPGGNVTVISRGAPATAEPHLRYLQGDASVPARFADCLEQAAAAGGRFTGLAMFQQYRGTDDPWRGKLDCMLGATCTALDRAADWFEHEGDRSVVLLSSNAARFACEEQDAGYHAAKAGLVGLCRYYASKLGALGIRVNCVAPGIVLKEESKAYLLGNPALLEQFRQVIALRRLGRADEVAAAVRFLLSPQASFITGQELVVDGGAGLRSQESLARLAYLRSDPPRD